jgi:hypothetical protein
MRKTSCDTQAMRNAAVDEGTGLNVNSSSGNEVLRSGGC